MDFPGVLRRRSKGSRWRKRTSLGTQTVILRGNTVGLVTIVLDLNWPNLLLVSTLINFEKLKKCVYWAAILLMDLMDLNLKLYTFEYKLFSQNWFNTWCTTSITIPKNLVWTSSWFLLKYHYKLRPEFIRKDFTSKIIEDLKENCYTNISSNASANAVVVFITGRLYSIHLATSLKLYPARKKKYPA